MSGHRAWGDQGELRLATRAVQRWQTAASVGCRDPNTPLPQPTVLGADQALCLPEYAWEKTHILYHLCVRDSQAEHFFPTDRKGN